MPNIKKKDKLRVFSVAMHESVVSVIDDIAEKQNVSRSKVIETVMVGWISMAVAKEIKEKQDESNN